MSIKFPIEVQEIKFDDSEAYEPHASFRKNVCGKMVAVRPCAEEYGNKTYLGVLLGSVALMQGCSWNEETGTLSIYRAMHNPMIFIPEKNAVVFGCGSWWGLIKDESHLRQISDQDIQNVWYVKAMKELDAAAAPEAGKESGK